MALLLWSAKKAINIFFLYTCKGKREKMDKKSKIRTTTRWDNFIVQHVEEKRKLDKCIEINPLYTGN